MPSAPHRQVSALLQLDHDPSPRFGHLRGRSVRSHRIQIGRGASAAAGRPSGGRSASASFADGPETDVCRTEESKQESCLVQLSLPDAQSEGRLRGRTVQVHRRRHLRKMRAAQVSDPQRPPLRVPAQRVQVLLGSGELDLPGLRLGKVHEISLIATLMSHPSWEIRIDTKSERTKHRLLLGAVYQLALIYRARHPKMWTHSGIQNRLVITKD